MMLEELTGTELLKRRKEYCNDMDDRLNKICDEFREHMKMKIYDLKEDELELLVEGYRCGIFRMSMLNFDKEKGITEND